MAVAQAGVVQRLGITSRSWIGRQIIGVRFVQEQRRLCRLGYINAATTHLWAPGVRRHMQNALREGATKEEILEVLQLTSIMGIHSMALAMPILAEELERQGAE